jgi:hypothetical protein
MVVELLKKYFSEKTKLQLEQVMILKEQLKLLEIWLQDLVCLKIFEQKILLEKLIHTLKLESNLSFLLILSKQLMQK